MGLRSSFEVRIFAAFLVVMCVIAALTALTWKVARDAREQEGRVAHTHEVLYHLSNTRSATIQIELSSQNYRLTGDDRHVLERDARITEREGLLQKIRAETSDNPKQQDRWQQLRQVVDERLAIARRVETLRRNQGEAVANAFAATAPLAQTRARTHQILDEMEANERQLLALRSIQQLDTRQRLVVAGYVVSVGLFVLLTATYLLIRRQLRQTQASRRALADSEATVREQNRLLEQHVLQRTEQLHVSETHLRNVIDRVPALIACVDTDQRYVYVNRQYGEQFAPHIPEITGCKVAEILGEERYRVVAPLIEKVLQGQPQNYDWEPSPGEWQVVNYLPIRDEQGRVTGYYVLGTDITERRRMEQALRESQQQLARVLDGADQGYWDWDLATNAFHVSARWETMLGYEPGEMQVDTAHWPQLVHPDDLPIALASIDRHMKGLSDSHEVELRCLTKAGDWRWVLTRGRIVKRADDGTPLIMSGTHTDITQRKQFELTQREAAVVFDSSYEGIMMTNADRLITKINPGFTRITGYTEAEVLGQSPRMLSSGRHDARFYQEFWESLRQRDCWQGEIWNRRKSGEIFAALQSISVVRDGFGQVQHYISVFTDISHIKAHEAELSRVANYDSLTHLPNRRLLSDRLKQAFLHSDRTGQLSAVCFMDLDGFKSINDQLGHEVGDGLLVGVAQHVQEVLRAEDTLARLGGDEFVLLLAGVATAQDCADILGRVLIAVQQPVSVGEHLLNITASVGVSLYPLDQADPDTLLRHADQAMYLAKQAGKNRFQLFDSEIDRLAQHHRESQARVLRGLESHEFVLHYQPKVDLENGDVIGVEALLRWQHPERGLVLPWEFLPYLHGSGLERTFGEWVIEQALCQIDAWAVAGLHMPISVNVSADHLLQADFCERLEVALSRHPAVSPSSLELEILESAAIEDVEQAAGIVRRCLALGVGFSLDDFGTGYSSLTYLRKLPVHTLKIDQSFVRDMLTDPDDLGIVKGVIGLANVFHRDVIAEGVETFAHGALLRELGCRLVQGYGIARPMPAGDLPAWCAQWRKSGAWA